MKTLQKFTREYLEQCRSMKPEEVVAYLENFRILMSESQKDKSRLISIKIPELLLETFRAKAKLEGIPYQTKIKKLMKQWIE